MLCKRWKGILFHSAFSIGLLGNVFCVNIASVDHNWTLTSSRLWICAFVSYFFAYHLSFSACLCPVLLVIALNSECPSVRCLVLIIIHHSHHYSPLSPWDVYWRLHLEFPPPFPPASSPTGKRDLQFISLLVDKLTSLHIHVWHFTHTDFILSLRVYRCDFVACILSFLAVPSLFITSCGFVARLTHISLFITPSPVSFVVPHTVACVHVPVLQCIFHRLCVRVLHCVCVCVINM